jgi:hypothetical protein
MIRGLVTRQVRIVSPSGAFGFLFDIEMHAQFRGSYRSSVIKCSYRALQRSCINKRSTKKESNGSGLCSRALHGPGIESEGLEPLNFHKMSQGEAIERLRCHMIHELHSLHNVYVLSPCRNRAMVLFRETKWGNSSKTIQCLLESGTHGTISNARNCELRR